MKRWLNMFWKRSSTELDIEAELKRSRPKPSDQLVRAIASRLNPRPVPVVRARARFGAAAVLTASLVAFIGATGGISWAGGGGGGGGGSAGTQYAVAPTISGVSPSNGKAGSSVTVTGTNFTGASAIDSATVNGDGATFTVTGSTTLSLTIPVSESPGVASIVVHNAAGDSNTNTDFTVLGTPHFDGTTPFSPAESGSGATVTISGTNLTGVNKVTFAGKSATIVSGSQSSTSLDVIVPLSVATTTGPVDVAITNPVTTTTLPKTDPNAFIYDFGGPTATTFTPTSGSIGDLVKVNGSNLAHTIKVYFGVDDGSLTGVATVTNNTTATSVSVNVPTGAVTGPITLDNGIGQATTKGTFTVLGTPSITSFAPVSGIPGVTIVTVNGTSFVTGHTTVQFTGAAASATATVSSPTKLTVKVPSDATPGTLTVTTPNGTSAASSGIFNTDAPVFDGATPFTPDEAGAGQSVDIKGSDFTGVTSVTFGGKPATIDTADSTDTHLFVTVPVAATTTGPVEVDVKNGAGTAKVLKTDPNAFIFDTGAPTVASFSPTSGAVGDTNTPITIKGTNLNHSLDIYFGTDVGSGTGETTIDNSAGSATSVTVPSVPSGAVSGQITVDNGIGQATSKASFTVIVTPSIAAFSPISGKTGTKVTLYGDGFTGVDEVTFNGVPATAAALVKTVTGVPGVTQSLSTIVPAGATTGVITVYNAAQSADTGGDIFTVIQKPTLDAAPFSPTSGRVGDSVTITGSGFTGVSSVKFGAKTATITASSDTSLTVTVPVGAVTGKVSVKNVAGVATSGPTFGVITAPTAVSSFAPATAAAGATITVTGAHFSGVEVAGGSVTFNPTLGGLGTAGTGVALLSDTKLTVDVPGSLANGTYFVQVANHVGSKTSTAKFTVVSPPTISGLGTTHGAVASMLTINGTNLKGASAVTFGIGNANGSTVSVKPATTAADGSSLTVKVPPMALSGKLTVTNAGIESNQSSSTFTVDYGVPTVGSLLPTKAAVGATVKITGTKFTGVQDGGSVKFNGTTATSVTVVSDTVINAVVPVGATTGNVTVSTTGGTSTVVKSFTVLPTPTISGYHTGSPQTALVKKSAKLTINGTNLVAPATVTFTNGSVTKKATATIATGGGSFTVATPTTLSVGTWTVTIASVGVTATGSVTFTVHA